jgi:hypothetical protein
LRFSYGFVRFGVLVVPILPHPTLISPWARTRRDLRPGDARDDKFAL